MELNGPLYSFSADRKFRLHFIEELETFHSEERQKNADDVVVYTEWTLPNSKTSHGISCTRILRKLII